jgi:hypothetical protein
MTDTQLGRLERVELRDIWASEAGGFTPWLARAENIALLGETLNLDLELEAQERSVGPFRADLLCKEIRTGRWVLIENQLERTDHTHLGQLLTYASGLDAVTIVWIAARFIDEHRSTLDWLNRITDESFRFFGLEVELWRIGSSPAAPKFNIVSKPNEWSHSVAQAARVIDDGALSETKILRQKYWTAFNQKLETLGGPVSGRQATNPDGWMDYAVGRSSVGLKAVIGIRKKKTQVELYLSGTTAKRFFRLLLDQKPEIQRDLGYELDWQELPEGQDSRIAISLDADPTDEADWPRQHEWLGKHLNDMFRVFAPRVRELEAE